MNEKRCCSPPIIHGAPRQGIARARARVRDRSTGRPFLHFSFTEKFSPGTPIRRNRKFLRASIIVNNVVRIVSVECSSAYTRAYVCARVGVATSSPEACYKTGGNAANFLNTVLRKDHWIHSHDATASRHPSPSLSQTADRRDTYATRRCRMRDLDAARLTSMSRIEYKQLRFRGEISSVEPSLLSPCRF